MKEYKPGDIRNFAIVGHASSGKTMLSEAMLSCAGVINRMGSIAAGSTVSDYHDNEQERQISVSATLMHAEWLGKKFNILDCPGYADFISEGLGALRVGDFALIVVHANHGVGVGTDAVWKYATEDGIPKMIVVNAFDVKEPKTKQFRQALDALQVETTCLLVEVARHGNRNLTLGSRNLEGVELVHGNEVHPYHLLRYDRAIFSQPAIEALQLSLKNSGSKRQRKPEDKEGAKGKKASGSPRRRARHEKAAEVA